MKYQNSSIITCNKYLKNSLQIIIGNDCDNNIDLLLIILVPSLIILIVLIIIIIIFKVEYIRIRIFPHSNRSTWKGGK